MLNFSKDIIVITVMVTPNGTGRNIDFEVDEDSGVMTETQDLSWLDDLNK